MRKTFTYIIALWSVLTLGSISTVQAQQAVYIPPGAHVFSHQDDSIGIFGNVINNGHLGSAQGAVVNFMGEHWENSPTAELPGNGGGQTQGGTFRFLGNQQQVLSSGFNFNTHSGPSFPNLSIGNTAGVKLEDLNDLHIRGDLHFEQGDLYLNGWNTLVDDDITGYSAKGFVVTGGDIGNGSLYRKANGIPNNKIVFPIGTNDVSYSPMGVSSKTAFNRVIGTTVFDHVYAKATTGQKLDSNVVKKTWQVKAIQGHASTKVLLQHDDADEGTLFSHYRDSSYISLYHRSKGTWDVDTLNHSVIHPGTLTTGGLRNFDYLNDRLFSNGIPKESSDSISWLSVSAYKYNSITCPVVEFKLWETQRYNHDWVQLFWRTTFEQNVMEYEVQRRIDTSSSFYTVNTIPSQGVNGISNRLLYYTAKNHKEYDGWIFYRLKVVSKSGCATYTKPKAISWGIDVHVWPNPSTDGNTHIRVEGIKHPIEMQLVDIWGQILNIYTLDNSQTLDVTNLSDAVYFLVFRDPKKGYRLIRTIKLAVQQAR